MNAKPRKRDAAQLRELPAPEKLARMIASGNYRLALRKRFLRSPLVILEKRVIREHGAYNGLDVDVWKSTHWEPATVTYDERPKVEDLPIAA